MSKDPDKMIIDSEEQWYEDHAAEFIPVSEEMRIKLIQAAKNAVKKTERMNIRMSKSDMEHLRITAAREGLPYQTLVANILHKYTAGILVDINEAKKILKLS